MIWRCLNMRSMRFAMGRHDSVLDPYAEFVTRKTVENDGIAYAMKHYGLI